MHVQIMLKVCFPSAAIDRDALLNLTIDDFSRVVFFCGMLYIVPYDVVSASKISCDSVSINVNIVLKATRVFLYRVFLYREIGEGS